MEMLESRNVGGSTCYNSMYYSFLLKYQCRRARPSNNPIHCSSMNNRRNGNEGMIKQSGVTEYVENTYDRMSIANCSYFIASLMIDLGLLITLIMNFYMEKSHPYIVAWLLHGALYW